MDAVQALARDADALMRAGWTVRDSKACAHILFPGANHIETVVVFDRPDVPLDEVEPTEALASTSTLAAAEQPAPPPLPKKQQLARDPSTPRARRLAAKRRPRK